jgi:hypothetical protein
MTDVVIHDAREYLFAIFEVTVVNDAVDLETRRFLGTGFFVTPKGDAITAAHVLPAPNELGPGRRVVATVVVDGKETIAWINHFAASHHFDVALIKVNLTKTKFFDTSDIEINPGTDVNVVGFPSHQVIGRGLEMRVLKGHATAVMPRLELNFPIPAGVSGSPVMVYTTVVGFATGRVRSEEIDEQSEEIATDGAVRSLAPTGKRRLFTAHAISSRC